MDTFLSIPREKKPTHSPSGEKNGNHAKSVPIISMTPVWSILRFTSLRVGPMPAT